VSSYKKSLSNKSTPSTTTETEPVKLPELIDIHHLASILGGTLSDGCLEFLLSGYGSSLDEEIVKLNTAIAEKDEIKARQALHSLQGSSGNLGMKRLSTTVLEISYAIKSQHILPDQSSIEKIKQIAENTFHEFKKHKLVSAEFSWYGDNMGGGFSLNSFVENEWLVLNNIPSLKADILKAWLKADSTRLFDACTEFATKLDASLPDSCPCMKRYVKELHQAIDNFDTEGIQKYLSLYPDILARLKAY